MFLLLWEQKPQNEFCHNMRHAKILHQILRHRSFWNPQITSSSCTFSPQSLLITALHIQYSQVVGLLQAFQSMDLFQQILNHVWNVCVTLICAALIALSPKAFWIIWIVCTGEWSSLMQNLMQICCSTCSVILNAIATQYTCSLNSVYHPHWLVHSSLKSSLFTCIPVQSPWLPGYLSVLQTILLILTMAGLFPQRLVYVVVCIYNFYVCVYMCVCICIYM